MVELIKMKCAAALFCALMAVGAVHGQSTTITQGVYQVNCGGEAAGEYAEDDYFSGGNAYSGGGTIDSSSVVDPAPDAVYQTERWGESIYTFPSLTPMHAYLVHMHFCENYHSSAGRRVFDLYANGVLVLNDYDIFAEAGARYKAIVEEVSVAANESGEIVLRLSNEVDNGKFSGIEIIDPTAPGIPVIRDLSDQTVVAGDDLVLAPSIVAAEPVSYQWSSNGIPIVGATNATLSLNQVRYAQDGNRYMLSASNAYGSGSANMTLTVLVKPMITDLDNQAVAPGTDVTLSPTVFGVPAPKLQWYYNGGILFGRTNETLSISHAQEADSGFYSLVAGNSVGTVTNRATLTVSSSPVAPILTPPADQTVVEGNNASFRASVAGLPLPSLQWQLNGVDIPCETNDVLTVANVQYAQNGDVYTLVARNSAGSVESSASLYVLVPPAISQQPTNIAVPVGSPATFRVTADGVPAVSYQWFRDGSPIAGATNSFYTVAGVSGADNGSIFSVTISNRVGMLTSSCAKLTVLTTMAGMLLPATGSTEIAPDQQLRIVFTNGSARVGSGKLYVHDASDDSLFATIDTSTFISYSNDGATSTNGAMRVLQGRKCYYEPMAVEDNIAWITLHPTNRFEYGKTYYVTMDTGLFLDSANASLPGIADSSTWSFSTKASGPATPTASTGPASITVGLDGTGDFATLQGAADWIPQNNTLHRTITIEPGLYRDYALFDQNRDHVSIIGGGADWNDVILYNPYPTDVNNGIGVLTLRSSDIDVRNMNLDTRAYETFPGRMRALITTGERLVFQNTIIKGGQDTLYAIEGSIYFKDCEIWGSVDFIYGGALTVFDECVIAQVRSTGAPITAPNTALASPYGEVFLNCSFPRPMIADGYPYDVGLANTTFQRPWGKDGMTAIINCRLGAHFSTMGWGEGWGNQTTARSLEFGSTMIEGGAAPTIAQRQAAGAYWLNTIDPDYVSHSSLATDDPLVAPPDGPANRVAVTVDPEDYTLEAMFGHACYSAELSGWMPSLIPLITSQPNDQSVNAGDPVVFNVVALGIPEPSYQWKHDGMVLTGATNATLSLPQAQSAEAGRYTVEVSNSEGTVISGAAVLMVGEAEPLAPSEFRATAGNDTVSLSWNPVAGADAYVLKRATLNGGPYSVIARLIDPVFTDTNVGNGTVYYYVVSAVSVNGEGEASAQVHAMPAVPAVSYKLNSGGVAVSPFAADAYASGGNTYSVGSAMTVSGVADAAPAAVYQTERWGDFSYFFFDLTPGADYGVRLHFAETYQNSAGQRLFNVIINGTQVLTDFDIYAVAGGKNRAVVRSFTATADENGQVAVQYVGIVDNAKSSGIELFNAETAPFIMTQPLDQSTVAGAMASFSVRVGGYPNPTFQWKKDGENLEGCTSATLTLTDVQAGDEGAYSVVVSNSGGSVTSRDAALILSNPEVPQVTEHPLDQILTLGQTALFCSAASGNPEPSFQWRKDGVDIPGAIGETLELENVQSADVGVYTCVAGNSYGFAVSSNATLKVEGPDGYCMVNGATTGGAGGPVVTVDTGDDFIAQVGMSGPRVILVTGAVSVGAAAVASDKTILGVGTNATIMGKLSISDVTNVIVRNVRVTGPVDDAIGVWNAQHVWVDHCTLYDSADGLCDVNKGSQYVTVSWCKFYYDKQPEHRFTMLVQGTSIDSVTEIMGYFTLHHNWWGANCDQRMAMSYDCKIHYYNNYFSCVGNSYASGAGNEAEICSENNYYSGVRDPIGIKAGSTGKIYTSGNLYPGCFGNLHPGTDTVFTPPYSYPLDSTAEVPEIVMSGAGADGPDAVVIPAKIWSGGGVDRSWNIGANWSLNETPKQADRIVFSGTVHLDAANNFPANTEFSGINFSSNAGAFVLSGNALSVGESIVDDSAALQTINADIDFHFAQDRYPSNRYFKVSDPSGSLVINGTVSGAPNGYFPAYCVTKQGPGMLTLNGSNPYSGNTVVEQGTLALGPSGEIPNSSRIILANDASFDVTGRSDGALCLGCETSLSGQGHVEGNLSLDDGASLSPGVSIGTLSISGALALNSGSTITMELNTALAQISDEISGMSSVAYGGTLVVANLGSALKEGDSFKLFNAAEFRGSFDQMTLPELAADLAWSNTLAVNGTLSVVSTVPSVNPTPTTMAFSVSGVGTHQTMSFSWPEDHIGWTLEANTNRLNDSSWFPVSGSVLTNELNIPVYPDAPGAFFRLRYP